MAATLAPEISALRVKHLVCSNFFLILPHCGKVDHINNKFISQMSQDYWRHSLDRGLLESSIHIQPLVC